MDKIFTPRVLFLLATLIAQGLARFGFEGTPDNIQVLVDILTGIAGLTVWKKSADGKFL